MNSVNKGWPFDFVLVDGDHTADGVRADAEDVLAASCTNRAVVLFHDTANDEVRAGLEGVDWGAVADLCYLDLDFVPGYAVTGGPYAGASWGGLGIALRNADDPVLHPEPGIPACPRGHSRLARRPGAGGGAP